LYTSSCSPDGKLYISFTEADGVQDNLIPPFMVNDGRIHATGNLTMHTEVCVKIRKALIINQLMDIHSAKFPSRLKIWKDNMKESKLLDTNLNSSRLSMSTGYSFLWFLKQSKQYKNIYKIKEKSCFPKINITFMFQST